LFRRSHERDRIEAVRVQIEVVRVPIQASKVL
jgi:hypothetical protein